MVLGELKSYNLVELFNKEEELMEKFKMFCESRKKIVIPEYLIDNSRPPLFTLRIKLEKQNGNNGEIENS
jgi:hypothetical protein